MNCVASQVTRFVSFESIVASQLFSAIEMKHELNDCISAMQDMFKHKLDKPSRFIPMS